MGETGLLGTTLWEHCHGLNLPGKQLLVLEETDWSELLGVVVGSGRVGLLVMLPGPLTMASLHSPGVS